MWPAASWCTRTRRRSRPGSRSAGPHIVSAADLQAAALAVALIGREATSAFLRSPEVVALPYDLAERVGRMHRRVRAGMLLSVAAP